MIVAAFIVTLVILTVIAYVAALRFPKWFFHSLVQHAQWRLRDDVMDRILAGDLDRHHDAVRHLMHRSDLIARDGVAPDYFELVMFSRRLRNADPEVVEEMRASIPSFEGLPEQQVALLEEFNRRQFELSWTFVMLNSWPGIIRTLLQVPVAIRRVFRERAARREVVSDVAFEAARKSHSVGSLVGQGFEPDAALAC